MWSRRSDDKRASLAAGSAAVVDGDLWAAVVVIGGSGLGSHSIMWPPPDEYRMLEERRKALDLHTLGPIGVWLW